MGSYATLPMESVNYKGAKASKIRTSDLANPTTYPVIVLMDLNASTFTMK